MLRRGSAVGATVLALALLASACGGHRTVTPVGDGATAAGTAPAAGPCDWPMWGFSPERTFSTPCATGISPDTVGRLQQRWFFNTRDVVTSTPAVVDGTVYVGDWSGRVYALDADTGTARWTFDTEPFPHVYAGLIVSSPAVADTGGVRTVYLGSGPVLYALRADTGELRWKRSVGSGSPDDYTEIESSPVVVDGLVVFGSDVHNQRMRGAGVHALDAATGEVRWTFDTDEGAPPSGCVDVWGSPSVDVGRRLVVVGTGSCDTSEMQWRPLSEAIVAVDLDKGTRRWAYQPHDASRSDLDFAGAPNLFTAGGRSLVGLGNKDGSYYALDRDTGALAWKTEAAKGGGTGGFIGPSAYARGIVAGATAVGGAPFLHGLDAATGQLLWQQPKAQASYAAAAEANGVVFVGGNDFTLRAVDLRSGDVRWSQAMTGVVAGGAVVVGDDVFAVAGIREPGLDKRSETSGVTRFSLHPPPPGTGTTTSSTSTTAPRATGVRLTNHDQPCVGAPCAMSFRLKPVPAGLSPSATLVVEPHPFRVRITTSGLGRPEQWITPGTDAAAAGASAFGLFISESDDNPVGGLLCVLGADGSCTTDSLPRLTPYNRITLLAVQDTSTMPTPADGLARLMTTVSFEPPLTPATP